MNADDIKQALAALSFGLGQLKNINGDHSGDANGEILFDEWDWEIGVGLYGDFRQAEAEGDESAIARIGRWYDRMIAAGLPRRQVNSTSPMLTLALLAERTGRQDWTRIVRDWADWIHNDMPRTEEGGYQHLVKERDNDGELWDDTLMMAALFMACAGKLCDRPEWVEDAHYQFLVHIRFLADRKTGLFYHGWTFQGRHNFADALWARGNAWLTIAIPELYRIAPPEGAIETSVREVYLTQVKSLIELQNAEGLWHTLLDDPHSKVEASGSAGFGYGMMAGIREGLLKGEIAARARRTFERTSGALLNRIDGNGLLNDVSDGTPMGHDLEFYRRIRNIPTPYGQALGTLFFSEYLRQL